MPTVLLTGATGFVGRACLALLQHRGLEVHAVARRPDPSIGGRHHRADLLDPLAASELMEKVQPTHLVHLAWITTPGVYWTSPANDYWIDASLHLVREFLRVGGRRAVFAGTCAEYDWEAGICREDRTPLVPTSRYGQAKHALHRELAALALSDGLSYAWARLFFLYGPHEPPGRLIPSVIDSLRAGERPACSEGWQRRDFIHVYDAAEILVQLLEADVEGPINVGTGQAVAVRDVVTFLAQALGGLDRVRWGALPSAGQPPLVVADLTRLEDRLAFEARFDWRYGLAHTVGWRRSQHARAA